MSRCPTDARTGTGEFSKQLKFFLNGLCETSGGIDVISGNCVNDLNDIVRRQRPQAEPAGHGSSSRSSSMAFGTLPQSLPERLIDFHLWTPESFLYQRLFAGT